MYDIEVLNEMNTVLPYRTTFGIIPNMYIKHMNENVGNPLTKKNGSKNLATTC